MLLPVTLTAIKPQESLSRQSKTCRRMKAVVQSTWPADLIRFDHGRLVRPAKKAVAATWRWVEGSAMERNNGVYCCQYC
jgi:hypothetical protein